MATPASTANPWASIITTGIYDGGCGGRESGDAAHLLVGHQPADGRADYHQLRGDGAVFASDERTTTDLSSLLESPIVLIGGIALFALMMLRH